MVHLYLDKRAKRVKMMKDEKFIAKWEPKHKKGLIKYVATSAFIY